MRAFAVMALFFFGFALVGCPVPESYIRSTEIGLENATNLDKNIDVLAKNYYTFISQDTKKEVAAGDMEPGVRKSILENVESQMANLKEQSLIGKQFAVLVHDQAHGKSLSIENILAAIKTINEATPEVLEFIDKLKGDG